MPIKRSWGIKPGGGKKANEFDDLDIEDRQIAEAEEKKAQAGIAPGSDHPRVVSHKNEAIKASKDKASLDLKFGEAKEIEMAKLQEEQKARETKEIKLSEATKWPGMEIDVDEEEIEWFQKSFRLKPFEKDVDTPVEKLGVLFNPREVKKELQAIYHARHEMIGKSELERRDVIIGHYEEYATAMASSKARAPRHFVLTEYLPLIRKLTEKELKDLDDKQRLELITSKHSQFSPPFRAMRDYLTFLAIFLAFLYCSFSTDKYEIRSKLTNQLNAPPAGFADVTTTTALQTWINDYFMDMFYPEIAPSSRSLTCQQKQYLSDGVNLRIGNVRMRQIRVGSSEVKKPWDESKVNDEYSTCIVPSMFRPAMGKRCFRTWGGQTFPEEMTNLYRGLKWHNAEETDTTEYYSVLSRLQWPGSGYTKLIANEHDLAQADFDSIFERTWIDIQTRAVFIEANLLNVPTSFISTVRLLVQFGAEGEILSTVDVDSTGIYRYHRTLQIARARFFSDSNILFPGFLMFLITFIVTGYICRRMLVLSILPTILFSIGMGICLMWWAMSLAYSFIEQVEISYFLMPGFEFLIYSCVFFQGILEIRFLRRATKSGDRLMRLCFYDTYNTLHLVNLFFWFTCFCMRLSSFSSLYRRLDSFDDAITQPCFKSKVAYDYAHDLANYTSAEAEAWAEAPDGCYGAISTSDDDLGTLFLDYGSCPINAGARLAAKCCAEVGFVSMFWPMELDIWVRQLMAFNAFLLCVRFFKFVKMFNSLALFSNTLTEAVVRVGHLAVIIMLIMTAFSVSFHLAFGFADQNYRDFPEAVKTLFEILLGSFDVDSLRKINPYLAPVFFYLYVLIIVMVVLSMFVAVVNNAYEGVMEHLAEPEYCFVRDALWHFCVDEAEKEPINSQHEIFQRMTLSKHFLRDPGTHTISDSDRTQLKDCIQTMREYSNGKGLLPGEPLPKFFHFRRPDGRSVDGTTTNILIKNTVLFRAVLSEKSGADHRMMVDDLVHLYWVFLQLPPLCWILRMKSFPGRVARWVFPTVEAYKKMFEIAEEEEEAGKEGEDEDEDDEEIVVAVDKRHMQNDDDMFLVKSGLTSAQIDLLHQLEEPKLSIMRGMSKTEEGQKRVLHAMDILTRTANEYKDQLRKIEEAKEAAAEKEAKKLALEEAEREAKAIRENPDLANKKKAAPPDVSSPPDTTETIPPPAEPKSD